jgi:hypothetical protein
MLRAPDWTRTRAEVTGFLEPQERPVTLFAALIPPPEWGGQIVDVILAPLVWAVWHATWRYSARAASRAAGVGLAPRMVIALTPTRMVCWRASRRWQLGTLAGELPRHMIAGATAPPGGTRSRALVLQLATGQAVTLKVGPTTADDLAAQLSKHLDDSAAPGTVHEA